MSTHFLEDTAVLTGRTLRHVTRSIDTIITTVVTPIAMMLLFVYVFGSAINTGSVNYIDYMLPGILLITLMRDKLVQTLSQAPQEHLAFGYALGSIVASMGEM